MKVLRFFICVVLAVSVAGCIVINGGCSNNPQFKADKNYKTEFAKDNAKILICNTSFGFIDISPSLDGTISVTSLLKVGAATQERADELLESVALDIKNSSGTLSVTLVCPDKKMNEWCGADITISMPDDIALDLNSAHGGITVNEMKKGCLAKTSFANIRVSNCNGDMKLNNSHGSISAVGIQAESIKCNTSFANIEVKDASGDLDLNNSHGGITVKNVKGKKHDLKTSFSNVKVDNITGDITCNNAHGGIEVAAVECDNVKLETSFSNVKFDGSLASDQLQGYFKNAHGGITVYGMDDFSGKVNLSNSHGSINTNLPVTIVGNLGNDKLRGHIGDGKGELTMNTSFGNIKLN